MREKRKPGKLGLWPNLSLLSLGTRSEKNYGIIWEFLGGGLPNSQNFCKFTKSFLVCQIHFEVLKNVYIQGEVISDQFYHLKFI